MFRFLMLVSLAEFLSCASIVSVNRVEELYIYNRFLRGGTTNNISNAFLTPFEYFVDTSISRQYHVKKEDLGNSLNNAKVRKHFQQKNAGITFAGEFMEQGKKHYFAYFDEVNLIIDFTEKKNYWLKEKLQYTKLKGQ